MTPGQVQSGPPIILCQACDFCACGTCRVLTKADRGIVLWHVCFVLTSNDRIVCVCLTFSADSDEPVK